MEILLLVMIFVLGLCFGSFVNMLVYRVADKYKLEKRKIEVKDKNRSFCDYCGRQLSWYENIPIISWLIQFGKTRCCRKKLPVLYPIVELLMGLLFVVYELKFAIYNSNLILWILGLVILVVLIFSAVFDLKYMILPDIATVILIIMALIIFFLNGFEWKNIIAAVIASGFLWVLHLITKGRGMGMGDVKLAFFMGLFLGYPKIIVAMYGAFIIGALVGLVLLITKKIKKKTQIPFGPFLILGTLIAWFLGNWIFSLSVFQFFR
jgi:prepilin signal peptidase PulO-like enzyme (type II secretory pathway)